MTDRKLLKAAQELSDKAIALDKVCNRANLDEIELQHLNDMVKCAREMFVDPGKYNPEDDQEFFG